MTEIKKTKIVVSEINAGNSISFEHGGVWYKPTINMTVVIDGDTDVKQRNKIIDQLLTEVNKNIHKQIEEIING